MTQGVEGHVGQADLQQQGLECAEDIALAERSPLVRAEDQVVVLPVGADEVPFLGLLPTMLANNRQARCGEVDRTPPLRALRLAEGAILPVLALHADRADGEIDVPQRSPSTSPIRNPVVSATAIRGAQRPGRAAVWSCRT